MYIDSCSIYFKVNWIIASLKRSDIEVNNRDVHNYIIKHSNIKMNPDKDAYIIAVDPVKKTKSIKRLKDNKIPSIQHWSQLIYMSCGSCGYKELPRSTKI